MLSMRLERLAIVGVGLIGGSVGLAGKAREVARRVIGVGRDEATVQRAKAFGAIDEGTTDLAIACREADFIVVATPVDRISADVLAAAAAAPSRSLITDVGSTKGAIVDALRGRMPPGGPAFIGSHPLAGSEQRGAAHARADLFDGKLVILTPEPGDDTEATAAIELFWQSLGARTMRMDAREHDLVLAKTSHVPHAAASAVAAIAPSGWLSFAAGGFRDTTRIAAGDPELWAAIFEANRDAVLSGTSELVDRLLEFQRRLEARDRAGVVHWLGEGKRIRDALGS